MASAAVLILVTIVLVGARRRRPYLLVGWLWYVIGLLPVIGVIQVGSQAMADRYMYIPLVGLAMMVAWGVPEALARRRVSSTRVVLGLAAVMVLVCLSAKCYLQVGVWRDSVTLFSNELAVNPNSATAHYNLGSALVDTGDIDEAVVHLERAVEINPNLAESHNDLALALEQQGDLAGAIEQYYESLRVKPRLAKTHNDLGISLANAGRMDEAIAELMEAVRLRPRYADAHYNLAVALASRGRRAEAIAHFRDAVTIRPGDPGAHLDLARQLFLTGDYHRAWREVDLCRENGGAPPAEFLEDLSKKMAEP